MSAGGGGSDKELTGDPMQDSGKGGHYASPKVDIMPALSYFAQAAQANAAYQNIGMSQYNNSIQQAREQIKSSYANAISTLRPQEKSSFDATNEMLKFMGMDPIQSTYNYADRLNSIGLQDAGPIRDLINRANVERDPARRAQLRNQIDNALVAAPVINNSQKAYDAFGNLPAQPNYDAMLVHSQQINRKGMLHDTVDIPQSRAIQTLAGQTWQAEADAFNRARVLASERESDIANDRSQARSQFLSDFNSNYQDKYQVGYTGDEVQQKIEATPGYKSEFDQGVKAIQRTAAAKGMLLSGNSLASVQNFGETQSLNYFNSHMQNLAQIAGIGSNAASSIANLQSTEGQLQSNLNTLQGSNAQSTQNSIGQGYLNSLMQSGSSYLSNAQYNTSMMYNEQQAMLNRAGNQQQAGMSAGAQMGSAAIASGPGYINAIANAQALGGMGSAGGGGGSSNGGGGWPTFNPSSHSWSV